MIELEKTYLAKYLPENLKDCKSKVIIDIYFPKNSNHAKIRLRKNGDKFEITKKELVDENDASHQKEQTIILSEEEFEALSQIEGKKVFKTRYYYDYDGRVAEVDVFEDLLKGLVLVDFEFETLEEKENFVMPAFCLVEVTQEGFVAGGMICGKVYEDIQGELSGFGYKKLFI
jgi:CYTH domain-containing protein